MATTFEDLIATFKEFGLTNELENLREFYDSIRQRAEAATTDEARQKLLVTLYDNFFQKALPKKSSSLGIVYTPIDVVDFILKSVDEALKKHFGRRLSDKNVHILDPFAGTGSFLVRLIHSGLIDTKDLKRKYGANGAALELHANEILLLAYYIATINVERAYTLATGENAPFEGTVLTDTFYLNERDDALPYAFFVENSKRAERQKHAPITVIVGNPPYSVGQESANDDNQNISYLKLDATIRDTYWSSGSGGGGNKSLYDSYVRAFRWASDRVGAEGVIGFITNGGFLDSRSGDGLRKCLNADFSHLYIVNLRGDARKQGDDRRKTGDGIFNQGSRAPIAISILVKAQKAANAQAEIHYVDTPDYATREAKFAMLRDSDGLSGLAFRQIVPDEYGDWLDQRQSGFADLFPLTPEKGVDSIFTMSSGGLQTNRDAWVYNFSEETLVNNTSRMISVYEQERKKGTKPTTRDSKKISWSGALERLLETGTKIAFDIGNIRLATYRPFNRQYVYFDSHLNSQRNKLPRFLPTEKHYCPIITVSGTGERGSFAALVTTALPDLHVYDVGTVCYPRYYYALADDTLLTSDPNVVVVDGYIRHDGISGAALWRFRAHYDDPTITKDAIFAYVYGVLHDRNYRQLYASNLKKERPRIPFATDFWTYSETGQALIDLHLAYESTEPHPLIETWHGASTNPKHLRVETMRYGKNGKAIDKTTIIYNGWLTLSGIPERAHEYVIAGRSALDWVLERYCVKTDKDSGIVNDANLWGEEHGNARYILDLIKSIVTVSLRTLDLVESLPGWG